MKELPLITLRPGKEEGPKRFHPWLFSGAIMSKDAEIREGSLVQVRDKKGNFLGMGHYAEASIAVRFLSFREEELTDNFWKDRIRAAYEYRKAIGIGVTEHTNAFRLVFGEGDLLPGLIIDIYDRTAVMQCHTLGMWNHRKELCSALEDVLGKQLISVYDKSADALGKKFSENVTNGYLKGSGGPGVIRENGHLFEVDWEEGQKTGFFIDQRESRKLFGRYSRGRSVLNTFCYSGGFSVYAAKGGAMKVDSTDVSEKAIHLARKNMELNGINTPGDLYTEDTFDFLEKHRDVYDLMVLDPPAFAKHHDARHQAVLGYKRLNTEALKRIRSGGILFTFSCSGVVDKKLFENTVMSAAIVAGRRVRIMHHLSQPPDHPVNIFHPEGAYLKGLVLFVE